MFQLQENTTRLHHVKICNMHYTEYIKVVVVVVVLVAVVAAAAAAEYLYGA